MAQALTETRNADNARSYGDDLTDVWLGRNTPGETISLPRNLDELVKFAETHLPLGWLGEDGVPIEVSNDEQEFYGLQGSQLILTKNTKTTKSMKVQCLEEVARVTELFWDHGKPKAVGPGESLVDLPASMRTIDVWCIARFVHGSYYKIYVFPNALIGERGTVEHNNSALTIHELNVKVRGRGWMITNNPDYFNQSEGKDHFPGEAKGLAVAEVEGVDVSDLQA